jgi:predicted oxidoreductase
MNNERSRGRRLRTDHVSNGVVIKLGERSWRYIEDIKEHTEVWSMHLEDIRIEKK